MSKKKSKSTEPVAENAEQQEQYERANKTLKSIVRAFQRNKPTLEEIIIVYGNLGYILGASFNGYSKDKPGPSPEEVQKQYLANPKDVGWAMMMAGLEITGWANNVKKADPIKGE